MSHTTASTSARRALVEANLSAVHWTIRGGIDVSETVCGMGCEALYQEGCLALCRAAAAYDIGPNIQQVDTQREGNQISISQAFDRVF